MTTFNEMLSARCRAELRSATSVLEALRTGQHLLAVSSGARQVESDAVRLKQALIEVGATHDVSRSPVRVQAGSGSVRYVADGDVDALFGVRYDGWFYGSVF